MTGTFNEKKVFSFKNHMMPPMKCDMGFGFRIALAQQISLKLDFAWPYMDHENHSMQTVFSIGIDY